MVRTWGRCLVVRVMLAQGLLPVAACPLQSHLLLFSSYFSLTFLFYFIINDISNISVRKTVLVLSFKNVAKNVQGAIDYLNFVWLTCSRRNKCHTITPSHSQKYVCDIIWALYTTEPPMTHSLVDPNRISARNTEKVQMLIHTQVINPNSGPWNCLPTPR